MQKWGLGGLAECQQESAPRPAAPCLPQWALGGQPVQPLVPVFLCSPPLSPKSHSARSGSFVVGVLINFILINSVISSCLQNLHRTLLRDGSAEGAANTRFISPLELYISYGWERVGWGKKQDCSLPAGSQCHFPNALSSLGWTCWLWSRLCLFFLVGPGVVCLTSSTSAPSSQNGDETPALATS